MVTYGEHRKNVRAVLRQIMTVNLQVSSLELNVPDECSRYVHQRDNPVDTIGPVEEHLVLRAALNVLLGKARQRSNRSPAIHVVHRGPVKDPKLRTLPQRENLRSCRIMQRIPQREGSIP
jgi:hypothetical protein